MWKQAKQTEKNEYEDRVVPNLPALARPPIWKEARKKESLKEFLEKKREIFLVKMAINYKEEEKKRLYEQIETAETKLKEKEKK